MFIKLAWVLVPALLAAQPPAPASALAQANADRATAMKWAFEGNCARTVEYESKVIAYWATREREEPGNAFYQEGEIANEAARVCIDSEDLETAAQWYRKGTELGLKEPGISADRRAVWEFRLQHAESRLAVRRGNAVEAAKHVAAAKAALEAMTDSRHQQEAFLPYLTGYVAFYLGDYTTALADLQKANQSDPFIQCLIGQTYDELGNKEDARAFYTKAMSTRAHNPPAAYAVRVAAKQLAR